MEEGKHTISERKIIIKHLYLVRGKYLLKERIPWEENSLHRVHGREGISPLLHVRKDKSYMFPKCIWEASREVFLQMTVICQNKTGYLSDLTSLGATLTMCCHHQSAQR